MTDKSTWYVGDDKLMFDAESSFFSSGSVTLFFAGKKGVVTQKLAEMAASVIIGVGRVVVTDRQVVVYHKQIKSVAAARKLAQEFIEELQAARHRRALAYQRASKSGARSQAYHNKPHAR